MNKRYSMGIHPFMTNKYQVYDKYYCKIVYIGSRYGCIEFINNKTSQCVG